MAKLEKNVIRISVRNLVEFILRSGDLDNRRSAGKDKEAMLAGGRLHRKIQRQMGAAYRAEVSLMCRIPMEELTKRGPGSELLAGKLGSLEVK